MVEVTSSCLVYLTRGCQTFTRAHGLTGRHTLHFKYNGAATLFVGIFGEDGGRLACCPESDSGGGDRLFVDDDHRGGDVLGGELALGDGRDTTRSSGTSSRGSSSDDGYDERPCCHARV